MKSFLMLVLLVTIHLALPIEAALVVVFGNGLCIACCAVPQVLVCYCSSLTGILRPGCAGPAGSGAVGEETVAIPQLQLVFLRGHCRSHARRCDRQMPDALDVTVAVASRGRSAHGGDEVMG